MHVRLVQHWLAISSSQKSICVAMPSIILLTHCAHSLTYLLMATSKPEVVTTLAVIKIETRFRRLYLGFRGRPEEWNIDRQRNVHARYRI